MSRIRVAIAQLPRMLSDIVVSMLGTEADIEVVGAVGEAPAFDERIDVVIVSLDDAESCDLPQALLAMHPGLRVVAIAADGRRIALYDMRPHRTLLGELSAAGLVAVVRSAGRTVELERNRKESAHLS